MSVGLIGAAELVADKKTKRPFDPKKGVGAQLAKFLEGHGAILRALGDRIAFCPPMIITEAELNELFDRFGRARSRPKPGSRRKACGRRFSALPGKVRSGFLVGTRYA